MSTLSAENHVVAELRGRVGCITLNRPQALNALSLGMIRTITQALLDWRDDAHVLAVVVRGMNKAGPFGAFCAGGDIRFFHQAALSGNPALEDFFIALNYSEGMGQLYAELLAGWAGLSDQPFNAFVDVYSPNKWGSWGVLRHLWDDNPRWRALARGCDC